MAGGYKKNLVEIVNAVEADGKAIVFGNYVNDPERYGVAEFDANEM